MAATRQGVAQALLPRPLRRRSGHLCRYSTCRRAKRSTRQSPPARPATSRREIPRDRTGATGHGRPSRDRLRADCDRRAPGSQPRSPTPQPPQAAVAQLSESPSRYHHDLELAPVDILDIVGLRHLPLEHHRHPVRESKRVVDIQFKGRDRCPAIGRPS